MLKNRVAALEKIVGGDSVPVCFFVRFHGVPLERAEWEGTVFERTNDESEEEFDARVRRSVLAAAPGPGFNVVHQITAQSDS